MLVAIAVILGFFSIRIGSLIRISVKFLPTFLCAALYGPFFGGACSALVDIVSYMITPIGGFMWQYTVIELIYGVVFGLFFKNASGLNAKNVIKTFICLTLTTLFLNTLASSYVLTTLSNRSLLETIITRLPGILVNMVFKYIGIFVILKFIPTLKKHVTFL